MGDLLTQPLRVARKKHRHLIRHRPLSSLLKRIAIRVTALFAFWIVIWFVAALIINGWQGPWRTWMGHAVTGGVSVSVVYGLKTFRLDETFTGSTEVLTWNQPRAFWGLLFGLMIGLLTWIIYYFVYRNAHPVEELTPNLWLYPPMGGVLGGIFAGLKMEASKTKTQANEGIVLSLRNSLLGFGAVWIVTLISLVLVLMKAYPVAESNFADKLFPATLISLGAGLSAFLWFGGIDVIRHYCLRLTLFLTGQMPWKIATFCDQMSDLILLQKVGGGYLFRNHLLRDHFEKTRVESPGNQNDSAH